MAKNKEQEQELRNQAYDLRLRGKSYRQIAEAMHIGTGTAHRWVTEYLESVTLPLVDQVRKTEVDRMLRYLDVLDSRIDQGDDKAVSLAIKVSERLCKMLGADMPTVTVVENVEVTEVDLAIVDLIARQKALNELELKNAALKAVGTEGESDVVGQ